LILSALILFLFRYRHQIRPLFSSKANLAFMLAATVLSFGIQRYTLNYLPFFDCLPYKKGNNINEQMKMPANAIPDSTVITFVYEKDGKLVKFTANEFPADFSPTTYKLVNRYDKVIRKGKNNEPPIKGFVLSGIITSEDSTQVILSQPYSVLIFFENFSPPVSSWKKEMEKVYKEARSRDIPVYLVTSRPDDAKEKIKGTVLQTLPLFKCDFTAVRTVARTSPTIYILKNGTILGKWSYRQSGRVIDELKRMSTGR
ncbi:MAG TPA: DoxX family protein, partial [Chitinophagaceae bacterium]|nr:DoxX family protein [Chitinophagaceae bacterium]